MARRPGVYLFEAGVNEDIFANDGKLFPDAFEAARRVLSSLKRLSFSSTCSIYPVHYEEDLVQEERRNVFSLKDWALAAITMNAEGELHKALIVNLGHHDEGYLVDLRYGSIVVAFYRGFDIREFPDVPVQSGSDFLSSIGIEEEEYAVSSDFSLDEDDEEAPIIEVEKPRFVANSKKKIVNFGGGAILDREEVVEDEENESEDLRIEIDRPSFVAGKKNKIANLGSSFSSSSIDEDDEEVEISVERPSFQAGNNKKPRNLNATTDRKKKIIVKEQPEHIEVEKPVFEARKKGGVPNITLGRKENKEPVAKKEDIKPIEKPSFVPFRQGNPEILAAKEEKKAAPSIGEEKNWVYTDVFKLKPRVFQGERAVLHDPKSPRDEKYFEEAKKQLSGVTSLRISKNCVFVPEVLKEDDPHLKEIEDFKLDDWDSLALTLNKDEQVLYLFLASRRENMFSILVSFKHKGAHVVVISTKGGAIDDRALPYYSYSDLRAVVFAK